MERTFRIIPYRYNLSRVIVLGGRGPRAKTAGTEDLNLGSRANTSGQGDIQGPPQKAIPTTARPRMASRTNGKAGDETHLRVRPGSERFGGPFVVWIGGVEGGGFAESG